MYCTKCRSRNTKLVWNKKNLYRLLSDIPWVIATMVLRSPCYFDPAPLKRRCRDCGEEFFGSVVPPRDYSKCFQCDYNLTGNVSGRCPECGWKLSSKHIEFLRKSEDLPKN